VVEELSQVRPLVAFLPGDGPLRRSLEQLGVDVRPGFRPGNALLAASSQYGVTSLGQIALESVVQQVRLANALRAARPEIVYCNGLRAQLAATLPSLAVGSRVVWHVRDLVPEGPVNRTWSLLARLSSVVIANSPWTAAQPGLARLRHKPVVVWNGIDTRRFPERQHEPPGPPVVGMAGHLTPLKGHLRFLRVIARVRQHIPEIRAQIAGGDIYRTAGHYEYVRQVRDEVARLGAAGHCTIDEVPFERMPHWMAGLTVLVHCPDRPETFGRVLVEAMAVGVPVVAASGPGAREVVNGGGLHGQLGDESWVGDAVLTLLKDPGLRARLAQAGAVHARHTFDEGTYKRDVTAAIIDGSGSAGPSLRSQRL